MPARLNVANRIQTTLTVSLSSTGGTLYVSSVAGMPAWPFRLVLSPGQGTATPQGQMEVVEVTGAIAGNSLPVARGKEGTTAANWAAGDVASIDFTGGTYDEIGNALPVCVTNYGAVADGVTANDTAFADALAARGTTGPFEVPPGLYNFTTAVPSIPSTVDYRDSGAILLLNGVPQQRVSYYHPQGKSYNVLTETFASGSSATTTGSMSSTTNPTQLTVASASTYAVGQGITVAGAGATPTISAPTAATATAEGTTGSTTIGYAVAALDGKGGVTASFAFNVTDANSALSATDYVALAVTTVSGAAGYAWWRTSTNGTSPTTTGYIGSTSTPALSDIGSPVQTPPAGVPESAPSAAGGDVLITQIVGGPGVTGLVWTLAAAASQTVSGAAIGHDDTAAIQAALSAPLNPIYVPPGNYWLSSTLTGQPGQIIRGETPETCRFYRATAYGDTLDIGTSSSNAAGAVEVSGLFFLHQYAFNNGPTYVAGTSTDIWNRDSGARHLAITNGQNVRIKDCWFWGCGYGIQFVDSTVLWVDRCIFTGMWDVNATGLQDSITSINAHPSSSSTRCAEMNITNCSIGGYGTAAPTSVTVGNVEVQKALNAGTFWGIYVESCEQFNISNNYIGGQSGHSIYLSSVAILNHGTIHDNDFDGAGSYSIMMESDSTSTAPNNIIIHHNTGVGYDLDEGFVFLNQRSTNPAMTRIAISHNVVQDYYQTPILVFGAVGVEISHNTVSAYNVDGDTSGNSQIESGCYVDSTASYVNSFSNTWGGGVNDPTSSNHCKWGIYFASMATNTTANERSAGLGLAGGSVVYGTATLTPPAQPLGNNVTYQNLTGQDIIVYQPITYLPTSSAAATVAVNLGSTSATTIATNTQPAGAVSGAADLITLRVPSGWFYGFLATNATIEDCTFVPA